MNETLGQSLFKDGLLWDDDPKEVGKRLGWPIESSTENSVSFRYYASPTYSLLGARPYSAALYGSSEKASGLSVVFANKGDCFASAGTAEAHFKEGRSRKIPRFCSSGSSETRNRSRKHWKRHWASRGGKITDRVPPSAKFLVGTGLGIVFCFPLPRVSSLALQSNPSRLLIPAASPKKLRICTSAGCTGQSVDNRANGDTVIRNIPMVDQGPKGYCVPATFERCMRYMEIPADMYLLAMAGSTGLGAEPILRLWSSLCSRKFGRQVELSMPCRVIPVSGRFSVRLTRVFPYCGECTRPKFSTGLQIIERPKGNRSTQRIGKRRWRMSPRASSTAGDRIFRIAGIFALFTDTTRRPEK